MFHCNVCPKRFVGSHARDQHMDALDHWGYQCPCCNLVYTYDDDLDEHIGSEHEKHYCTECDRRFQNENNLRQHMRSKIHQGSNISCPFCKKHYTTASGLSHHLETSSCTAAPQLNREQIHHQFRIRDPHGIFTEKSLEWHPAAVSRQSWDPTQAWNGQAWACYICHRNFFTKGGLSSHVSSPAHQQKLYHCPNRQCSRQFVSMAGFLNHLESESCGYTKFDIVQHSIGRMFNPCEEFTGFTRFT